MQTILFIQKAPVMKLIFGFALFGIGIHGALFNNIFILVISGIGVFLLLQQGSEIDLTSKKYRKIYSVLGIHFGRWKPLPELEYVSVFKTKENKRVQSLGASANMSNEIYKLNLFYNRNRKIQAYKTAGLDDAFNVARQISEILNIDILDATERTSKWL